MKPNYLIDTDWVIDHFHGITEVTEKLREYKKFGLAISIATLAELYEGVYFSRDPITSEEILEKFLTTISIIFIDQKIAQIFAQERGKLRKKGAIIGDFDLLIAATALSHGMILLTNNRNHFERIENLRIESILPKSS